MRMVHFDNLGVTVRLVWQKRSLPIMSSKTKNMKIRANVRCRLAYASNLTCLLLCGHIPLFCFHIPSFTHWQYFLWKLDFPLDIASTTTQLPSLKWPVTPSYPLFTPHTVFFHRMNIAWIQQKESCIYHCYYYSALSLKLGDVAYTVFLEKLITSTLTGLLCTNTEWVAPLGLTVPIT